MTSVQFETKLACIAALLGFLPALGLAGWFGPNDYDECIIEGMAGVKSDLAARLVVRSCREKFPVKSVSKESTKLPPSVISGIEGTASAPIMPGADYYDGTNFEGTIYNGNGDWYVQSVVIRITDTSTGKYRDYEADFTPSAVAPLGTRSMHFKILKRPEEWSWHIHGAYGYKK